MFVEPGKTYVRRLHAVSAERDALALRLRLERALAGADLRPPGLPASAILCVRRLSDRRVSMLLARGRGALALADWERAVAATIEQLARRAASPAHGPVPANAEAVIFRDEAELLACLAADWCGEAAPARWWWQSLFGGRDAAAALVSAWLAAPAHVPAALGRLAAGGRLVPFVRALGEGEARAISRNVLDKFGLHRLRAALETPPARQEFSGAPSARAATADGEVAHDEPAPPAPPAERAAPWEPYAPELRGLSLGGEQSCLAGVGLMLLRAPARVRADSFAGLVESWRGGRASAPGVEGERPQPSGSAVETKAHADEAGHEAGPRGDGAAALAAQAPDGPPARASDEGREVRGSDSRQLSAAPTAPVSTLEDEAEGGGNARAGAEAGARHVPRQTSRDEGEAEHEPLGAGAGDSPAWVADESEEVFAPRVIYEARVETSFGGLFYLVNVGLFLNLYGDFTTPRSPGLALPVWDFVALLGRRLCGARVTEDPVWPLLAGLTGRATDEEPGWDFEPPDEWRLPADWLAPFPRRGAWEWAADGERLRVRHPAGFLVLDVPLGGSRRPGDEGRAADGLSTGELSTQELLADELKPYAEVSRFTLRRVPAELFAEAEDEGGGGACRRWLARLAPYVSARLCRALGVGEAAAAARLACEQRARVDVTETRIDVTFELARLPVEVRLSGLDRDPGWVPAAGRHVAFHYE